MDIRPSVHKTVSGTLLIAGTTIGAGMLGIPLLTAQAGFWPAVAITAAVWLFMVCTGFLYLEATLWMHEGANVLSLSKRFLGRWGQWTAGFVYLFLYYCLMVAYFAAGAPIFADFMQMAFGLAPGGMGSYLAYGLLFGGIVAFGVKLVDRVNYLLMIGMFAAYAALMGVGAREVEPSRLSAADWSQMWWATPVLFSAFGYHNVIPSLTSYFHRNGQVLRRSIVFGTAIPLVIYLFWQWLIIGAVSPEAIARTLDEGLPATAALQSLTGLSWAAQAGRCFAFFAVVTSMLGVAFSMVDFLGDGLSVKRTGASRVWLTFLTFLPPFLFTIWDPAVFVKAIGFAGGFGEAFLNGILPVALVWVGRYIKQLGGSPQLGGQKISLLILFVCSVLVMGIELFFVF